MLRQLTNLALIGVLAVSTAPALAQTGNSGSAPTPPASGMEPGPDAMPMSQDSMRAMMREMMQEMMQESDDAVPRRGENRRDRDRAERAGWRNRHREMDERGPRGGMRHGMHRAGMRVMFAIMDADGNGALALQEVQDFHARIFDAIDDDGNGEVTSQEIEGFFRGPAGELPR
jgi:hypothetical protein